MKSTSSMDDKFSKGQISHNFEDNLDPSGRSFGFQGLLLGKQDNTGL